MEAFSVMHTRTLFLLFTKIVANEAGNKDFL